MLSSQELSQLKNYPSTTLISYNVTKKIRKEKPKTGDWQRGSWLETVNRYKGSFKVRSVFFFCLLGADIEASYWRHFYVEDGGTLSRCWTGPLPHRFTANTLVFRTCQECGNCHKFDLKFSACLCWSGPTQIKHVHIHIHA